MVCTADGFGLLRRMIPYNPAPLLCLTAAVEEGHDLRSCAVVAGAEQTAADILITQLFFIAFAPRPHGIQNGFEDPAEFGQ